jgi:hypothetical protein
VIFGAAPFLRTTTRGKDGAAFLAGTHAGNSAISGVPFGPANPRVLTDPSGIGNASRIPPLGTNSPVPPVSYGSVNSLPPSRTRVVAPPYAGASQRIISAHNIEPRSKAPVRRRGRAQVSTFTGICRGC